VKGVVFTEVFAMLHCRHWPAPLEDVITASDLPTAPRIPTVGFGIGVSDNGPGIPPSLREKIAAPFVTIKTPEKATGQGLALAKAIIVNHHGSRLHLHDTQEFSANFTAELPPSCLAPDGLAAGIAA